MRIYRPNVVEDANATASPPCWCWAWSITPEMGAYREVEGNAHHPHCPRLWDRERAAASGAR